MTAEWIQSDGGPLLVVPSELLHEWGGIATSDYERACEVVDEIASIRIGAGTGLVLGDEPLMTSWVPGNGSGTLVRWVYANEEADVWTAVDALTHTDFQAPTDVAFAVGESGRCTLMDSADTGSDLLAPHMELELTPGAYSVRTATLNPNETTRVIVHRLTTEDR